MTTPQPHRRKKEPAAARFAPAPVLADAAYTLELFKSITGLDAWALRMARRNGLKVITVGRRRFVRGRDFLTYLDSQSADQA